MPVGSARFTLRGLPQAYWLAAAAVVCAVAIEFCMVTWTPDLLTTRTGMSPERPAAPCPPWSAGWPSAGCWSARSPATAAPLGLFLVGVAVTAGGWVFVWLSTNPVAAVAGLFVVGLGVAGQYPLGRRW